jgi:hypothetical protein
MCDLQTYIHTYTLYTHTSIRTQDVQLACARIYRLIAPLWRTLRNDLKKSQIPSQRGCVTTLNFIAQVGKGRSCGVSCNVIVILVLRVVALVDLRGSVYPNERSVT